MGTEQSKPKGPDLARGVPLGDVPDGGMVGGHVGDDAVLLARHGDELFAIDLLALRRPARRRIDRRRHRAMPVAPRLLQPADR